MRALVINLDRSPGRLMAFREQAERLGFSFERLAAVDASTITTTPGLLTSSEVGCFESHRQAWLKLVESGDRWLAVFEDDVLLAPVIPTLLASDDWIPSGTDVVKLETFNKAISIEPKSYPAHGYRLHRLRSTHWGSAGYIISRRWAARLLKLTESYTVPVDWALFDFETDGSFKAKVMQMVPAPCIQEQWLAHNEGRIPVHDTLITRVPPQRPVLSRAAKYRRELRRIGRQIVGIPRKIRRRFVPLQRMVVPYEEIRG
ncbi:glycosyl transferase [Kaistia sp. 32K]|uniref:glycosyltransferase family 25 protein n=1 Tax=Kaistia sp. 32K TaxID=2795690 RepID=UPI001915D623|nr:glycosyltransferase family 25 protein [Kaistia sp. 32K]BCP53211.1 glycosyl transferase [Kaistia sp. 32K]